MSEHTMTRYDRPPPNGDEQLPYGITMAQIYQQVTRARRTIVERKMGRELASRFADNVESKVLYEVWKSVQNGKFNPELGSLASWVNMVSDLRTRDELKEIRRNGSWKSEKLFSEHPEKTVDRQMEEALYWNSGEKAPTEGDLYAEIEADRVWLHPVVVTCGKVMDQRKFFRAYMVANKFNWSATLAAEYLGIDAQHLRECLREFKVHLQVIHLAKQAQRAGAIGTMSDLTECLPKEDEAGGHRRRIAEGIQNWHQETGKRMDQVSAEYLVAYTGDSYNTIRQRLPGVLTLLRVALTVITYHSPGEDRQEEAA